jgi:hypothetical protein
MSARRPPRLLQCPVVRQGPAVRFLVRGHDVNAAIQPRDVVLAHVGARRAIDDDRVRYVVRLHVIGEFLEIQRLSGFGEPFRPTIEIDRVFFQQHAFRTRDPAHPQVQIERAQTLDLRLDLRQQHTADGARSDQTDG